MRLVYEPLLPKGYTRLEYLESTGTQYIDTNISLTSESIVDLLYEPVSNVSTNGHIFGVRDVAGAGEGFGIGIINSKFVFDYKGRITANSLTIDAATKYRFVKDKTSNKVYVDGTEVFSQSNSAQTFTLTNKAYIFRMNDAGASSSASKYGRVYYCKIWDNNKLVRDLIPVLNSSNVAGLYDRVSGTFFTNAGSGEFLYPTPAEPEDDNVIDNPRYQQVEYLESDSTAYIDTGISGGNNNLKIEMGFSYSKFYAYGYFFSNYESEQHNTTRLLLNASDNSQGLAYINTKSQNGAIYTSNLTKNDFHTFVLTKTSVSIDGNESTITTPLVGTANTKNIILFNRGAGTYYEKRDIGMRCYYFRIYDNNVLVRHLIPVIRKTDNKPGMYDKVTGNFYTNAGTGEFTVGDKVNQVLPNGYEKLEYLETTNQQTNSADTTNASWIDTGIKPDDTTQMECRVAFTTLVSGNNTEALFGSTGSSTGNYRFAFGYASLSPYTNFYVGLGGQNLTTSVTRDTNVHTFKIDAINKTWAIDDTSGSFSSSGSLSDTHSIFLFARHNPSYGDDKANKPANAKTYYCKIWQNNTIVRDLVPALRKADNKPGLYDFATGQFFTKSGTGAEFTYAYPAKPLSNSKLRIVKSGYTTPTLTKPLVTRLIAGGYV